MLNIKKLICKMLHYFNDGIVIDETFTYSPSFSASSGGNAGAAFTVTKAGGYYPLMIASIDRNNGFSGSGSSNFCIGRYGLINMTIGSATVEIYGNAAGGSVNKIRVGAKILWKKI